MPSTTNGLTPSSAVNGWDTAFPVPDKLHNKIC